MKLKNEKQSKAKDFVEQTSSLSSYMISSRASRKHLMDQAEQQIIRFRDQIQKRFAFSVANKIYCFPLTMQSYENIAQDNKNIEDLEGGVQICLYDQLEEKKQVLKNSDYRFEEDVLLRTDNLLKSVKRQRQKMANIKDYVNKHYTKNKERTSHQSSGEQSSNRDKKASYVYGAIKQEYGAIKQEEQILRKRLYTEPYQKPMGFILKKK